MHTASSANRAWIAPASAVLWTATVAMPSSRLARTTRSAISPRLEMSSFLNTVPPGGSVASPSPIASESRWDPLPRALRRFAAACGAPTPRACRQSTDASEPSGLLHAEQHVAVLDGLAVLDRDLDDGAGDLRLDLVHEL